MHNIQPQTVIMVVSATFSVIALASGVVCFLTNRRMRTELNQMAATAVNMETEMIGLSRDLDTITQRLAEHLRRLREIERRGTAGVAAAVEGDLMVDRDSTPKKPSITERRHRVLSLARRGLKSEEIAATLNVPHGEVELMINLNSIAA